MDKDNNNDNNQNSEFMEQIEQFLPQLEICKKKHTSIQLTCWHQINIYIKKQIQRKMDEQAEKVQKYKLYKAKVQRNIDMYTQQYGIIENDLANLQAKLSTLNGQFLKSKISDLKNLKEDAGKLLEVFVYIQTGKENNFDNVKNFLQKQNTIDLNLNFMDYSSIDLLKLEEVWKNRIQISSSILTQKQYSKYQQILKQVLDWILTFYEIIIKQEILQNIESMYHEYSDKKEVYQNQYTKNEFIYKYFKQLYQQLQNYITAIQEQNPLINEAFAESLTKLIEEIFRKDNAQKEETPNIDERINMNDIPLQNKNNEQKQIIKKKSYSQQANFNQRQGYEDEKEGFNIPPQFQKVSNVKMNNKDQMQKSEKQINLPTGTESKNNEKEQEGNDGNTFKKLLSDHKAKKRGIFQTGKGENIQMQDKENEVHKIMIEKNDGQVVDSNQKMLNKVKSNSTHNLNLNEQQNNYNPFLLNNSMLNNYEQEKQNQQISSTKNNAQTQQTIMELIQSPSQQANNQKYFKVQQIDNENY